MGWTCGPTRPPPRRSSAWCRPKPGCSTGSAARNCWSTPDGLAAGEARARAAQLLDVLDLTADAKRLVADYSTGMRKKAALGCALIHNPSVLFLDEPLEGVAPVSADAIRRMLTNYVGSGSTVLFSSHVMELVEQVCDHVSIMSQGQIVPTGTTEQVRGGKTLQRAFIDLVGSKASE